MKEADIIEGYDNLSRKYKIPKFDALNEDFEIEFIKKKPFLLRQVRRKMNEKVVFFCRIIESLLYPNPQNIINAVEINSFSSEDKSRLEKIYRELMHYERIKKSIEETVRIMQESWKKDIKEKENNNYFG